ncbi:MAG: hypothetical protein RLZZ156_82 [Deinococcota bacterium]
MLEKLQQLLIEQKAVLRLDNPQRAMRITQGFHQLQLIIFLTQLLILIILVGLLLMAGSTRAVSISNWFLIIGISLTAFAMIFSEKAFREEPTFLALLRLCILTSVSSSIPAMLAALAWRFEGLTLGVLGLFFSSLTAFFICWTRLELLATLIPQNPEEPV